MKFKPGQVVTLYADDGASVLTTPFFSTRNGAGVVCELVTETGEFLRVVDEGQGVYELRGRRLRQRNSSPPSVVGEHPFMQPTG